MTLFGTTSCILDPNSLRYDDYLIQGHIEYEVTFSELSAYRDMVLCIGNPVGLGLGDIRFFTAERIVNTETGVEPVAISVHPHNDIYVHAGYETDMEVVGHEVLHLMMPGYRHCDDKFSECDPRGVC